MTDRAAFATAFDVPRETLALFDSYAALLSDWQGRMNLVGPSTLPAIWERHFTDSAQIMALATTGRSWLDIGAGAGFPGLVIALLDPDATETLVESVTKKCRFLAEAVEHLFFDIEPVAQKMRAFGWHTQEINGNDMVAIVSALTAARMGGELCGCRRRATVCRARAVESHH